MRKRLRIPYVSQLGPGAEFGTGDCGLTCVTALARAFGHKVTVDEVCKSVGLERGFEAAHITNHIAKSAQLLGIRLNHKSHLKAADIEAELKANRTVLLLVHYPFLEKRFDPEYSQGHFITVTGVEDGFFFYDDPFWPDRRGEDIRIGQEALINAASRTGFSFKTPGQALLLRSHTLPDADETTRDLDPEDDFFMGRDLDGAGFTLRGTVRDAQGKSIAGASARLIGSRELLGDMPGATMAPPPGAVVWSRVLTGFEGHRARCWETFVRDQTGLPFHAFKDQVLDHNPDLVQDGFVFQAEKEYLLPERAFVVAWSRPVTGISGARWQAFMDHVSGQVQGISATQFIADVMAHNPSLDPALPVFKANRAYRFPENLWGGDEIAWTRPLTGFLGNRSDGWEAFVKDSVPEMTFAEFKDEVERRNPTLGNQDRHVFRREQSYVLPEKVPAARFYAFDWSDGDGAYEFAGLRAGRYELEVVAAGQEPQRVSLLVQADVTRDVTIAPPPQKRIEPERPAKPNTAGFIQRQGTSFTLDGRPFRFVGVNIRGIAHYGDANLLNRSQPQHQAVQLDAAGQMGARVVRLFLANRHLGLKETAGRFEALLGQAEARNLYILPAFGDVHGDTGFNPPGDERFYTEHGMLNRSFYEGGYRENFLPFVEFMVGRFKGHKRIFAWELGNEFKPLSGGVPLPELFIDFARAVSNHIRELDPIHLIGTGIINSGSLGCNAEQARRLYRLPNLDFLCAHIYEGVEKPDEQRDWLENQRVELARAEQEADLARELGKPFIIEEIGFCGGDRVQQTTHHLSKWYDAKGAAACLQWGLMATDHDNGDGDNLFGLDRSRNSHDFQGLLNAFRQRATAL